MSVHPDSIYEFAVCSNSADAKDKLAQLLAYLISIFDEEKDQFAEQNNVELRLEEHSELRESYIQYLTALLIGMRDRCLEKQQKMQDEGKADRALLFLFVMNEFDRIEDSEWSNSKQLAQLEVVQKVRLLRPNAIITKRWVAHVGACDYCMAMDGVEVPIDQPFLVSGQTIMLHTGEELIYNYIDRDVAVLHPHDRCYVEFIITY